MIGQRIKQSRLSKGYSLRDLARLVGMSHSAVALYEKDELIPDSAMLLKFSKALDVKCEYFFRKTIKLEKVELTYRRRKRL